MQKNDERRCGAKINKPIPLCQSSMTIAKLSELGITHLPDHTELPESNGTVVFAECAGGKNF